METNQNESETGPVEGTWVSRTRTSVRFIVMAVAGPLVSLAAVYWYNVGGLLAMQLEWLLLAGVITWWFALIWWTWYGFIKRPSLSLFARYFLVVIATVLSTLIVAILHFIVWVVYYGSQMSGSV